ncbi:MAG: hypothetical protein Q9218_005109 [Villophora microphyllina]
MSIPCQERNNDYNHSDVLNANGFNESCYQEEVGANNISANNPLPFELQTRSGIDDISDLFLPESDRNEEKHIFVPRTSAADGSKATAAQHTLVKPRVAVNLPSTCLSSFVIDTQEVENPITPAVGKSKKRKPNSGHEQRRRERRADYRRRQIALHAGSKASGITTSLPNQANVIQGPSPLNGVTGSSQTPVDFDSDTEGASSEIEMSSAASMPDNTGRVALPLPQNDRDLQETDGQLTKHQDFTSRLREVASPHNARTSSANPPNSANCDCQRSQWLQEKLLTQTLDMIHNLDDLRSVIQKRDAQLAQFGISPMASHPAVPPLASQGSQTPICVPHSHSPLPNQSHSLYPAAPRYDPSVPGVSININGNLHDDNEIDMMSKLSSDQDTHMGKLLIDNSHYSGSNVAPEDKHILMDTVRRDSNTQAFTGVTEVPVEVGDESLNEVEDLISFEEDDEQLLARGERIASSLCTRRKEQPIEASNGGDTPLLCSPPSPPDTNTDGDRTWITAAAESVPDSTQDDANAASDKHGSQDAAKPVEKKTRRRQKKRPRKPKEIETEVKEGATLEETAVSKAQETESDGVLAKETNAGDPDSPSAFVEDQVGMTANATTEFDSVSDRLVEEEQEIGILSNSASGEERNGEQEAQWMGEPPKQEENTDIGVSSGICDAINQGVSGHSDDSPDSRQRTLSGDGTQQIGPPNSTNCHENQAIESAMEDREFPQPTVEKKGTESVEPKKYGISQKRQGGEHLSATTQEHESAHLLDGYEEWKKTVFGAASTDIEALHPSEGESPSAVRHKGSSHLTGRMGAKPPTTVEEHNTPIGTPNEGAKHSTEDHKAALLESIIRKETMTLDDKAILAYIRGEEEKRLNDAIEATLSTDEETLRKLEEEASVGCDEGEPDQSKWETVSDQSTIEEEKSHLTITKIRGMKAKGKSHGMRTLLSGTRKTRRGKNGTATKADGEVEREEAIGSGALMGDAQSMDTPAEKGRSRISSLFQRLGGFF